MTLRVEFRDLSREELDNYQILMHDNEWRKQLTASHLCSLTQQCSAMKDEVSSVVRVQRETLGEQWQQYLSSSFISAP